MSFRRTKDLLVISLISAAYLLLSWLLIGLKPEQLFLVVLFISLYFISPGTRKFILGFSIFIIYWIVFDYMKAFPNYRYHGVHIESLYLAEKKIFGIYFNGSVLTPNEYWLQHTGKLLDILSGVFYLMWIPLPLLFAFYLFYTDRRQFFLFAFTFFWVNLLGFVIYYSYPAAPPWYVAKYGFSFHPATPGSTAGLGRFDELFHVSLFKSIYAKSSNVFAAMPSLHSSYPLIVLYFGIKNKLGWVNLLFAAITAGIWLSAVYTSHHYVLDVLAGIGCGLTGIFSFQWIMLKSRKANDFIQRLVDNVNAI